ncbi:MAG: TetR/AcrR family transcriptional regulator [Ilumatobacter sp.]|nr:TetR/AcrR family transcriptional regulator [Ilumatobacter sp.]
MTDRVKRDYDASNRQADSAATRARIIDTARGLFTRQGYRATTIHQIAAGADVHVDTVYRLVGRKAVVLRELIEQAISGTDRAVPAEERDYVVALKAEADPGRKIAIYASAMSRIQPRMAPLLAALDDASRTEAEAAEVWQSVADRRAANMRRFVEELRQAGGLRPGLTVAEAADTVWATNSPELYLMLVRHRGWTPEQYEAWLADLWAAYLLPGPG